MIPLAVSSLPANAASLRDALEEGLRQFVRLDGTIVTVEDRDYPELAAIRISLDNATLVDRPAQPAMTSGEVKPALQIDNFEITGAPIRLREAAINLSCRASQVVFGQALDAKGRVTLVLQKAAEGFVEVVTSVSDLENAVRTGARAAGAEQGVKVEDVKIDLRSRGDRALDATVSVRAKKLFLSATVRINGSATIDENLSARLSGLTCTGEGPLGSLACGFLNPYLQRFEGREFSLLALPLGEVKLRDVRLAAGKDLQVTAQFGQAPA